MIARRMVDELKQTLAVFAAKAACRLTAHELPGWFRNKLPVGNAPQQQSYDLIAADPRSCRYEVHDVWCLQDPNSDLAT